MSTTKELIADLQMYAGDNGYGHIDYADTMRNAAAAIEALSAEVERLKALSVTNILMDDASDVEVYAQSVDDVERMLMKLAEKFEDKCYDFDGVVIQRNQARAERDQLRAQPAQGLTDGEIDWAAVGRIIETHTANRDKFLTGTTNWGAAIYRAAIQKGQQS